MDVTNALRACISTMERMSVTGFDNADRYVGVIQTLRQAVSYLETKDKEEVDDG